MHARTQARSCELVAMRKGKEGKKDGTEGGIAPQTRIRLTTARRRAKISRTPPHASARS